MKTRNGILKYLYKLLKYIVLTFPSYFAYSTKGFCGKFGHFSICSDRRESFFTCTSFLFCLKFFLSKSPALSSSEKTVQQTYGIIQYNVLHVSQKHEQFNTVGNYLLVYLFWFLGLGN